MPGIHCSSLLVCGSDPMSLRRDTSQYSVFCRAFLPQKRAPFFPLYYNFSSEGGSVWSPPTFLAGLALRGGIQPRNLFLRRTEQRTFLFQTHASILVSLAIHGSKAESPRQILFLGALFFFFFPFSKSSSPISSHYTQDWSSFENIPHVQLPKWPFENLCWGVTNVFGSDGAVGSPPLHSSPSPAVSTAPGKCWQLMLCFKRGGKKGKIRLIEVSRGLTCYWQGNTDSGGNDVER